jgi:N-ethylmaleimide reductase
LPPALIQNRGYRVKFGFGTLFISNPDLVERFKNGWPLNAPDPKTFYGGDAKGYTDDPTY